MEAIPKRECQRRDRSFCRMWWLLVMCLLSLELPADPVPVVAGVAPLKRIGDILRLGHEPGYDGLEVQVSGVITYCEPSWRMAFIQDETGGIYFFADTQALVTQGATVGRHMSLKGKVGRGRLRPIILGTGENQLVIELVSNGFAPLPTPIRLNSTNLSDFNINSQWVEVAGNVGSVKLIDDRAVLELSVGGTNLEVTIPGYTRIDMLPKHLSALDVVVRGVMGASWDSGEKFLAPQLMSPSVGFVEVQSQALARLFDVPIKGANEVNQGSAEGVKIRLKGTVVANYPELGFFLLDSTGTIWIESTQKLHLERGDEVDVVGLGGWISGRSALRDGYARKTGKRDQAEPRLVDLANLASEPLKHGEWVTVEAQLTDTLRGKDDILLRFMEGSQAFAAHIRSQGDSVEVLPQWQTGSRIKVEGVVVKGDWAPRPEFRLPGAWRLMVHSSSQLRLISPPGWWTAERLSVITVALLTGTVVAGACVIFLRRQVQIQSETIAEQRARVALSEERGRISRELHDSLEQYLTGLSIQLEAVAAKLGDSSADVRRMVDVAQQMVRHGHDDARAAIWELRAKALERGGLIQALEELIPIAAIGSPTKIKIEVPPAPIELSAEVEHHLLRITQEAVTNSIKHAGASCIWVGLTLNKSELHLSIQDDGKGFSEINLKTNDQPGFGLIGMRERAIKLSGRIEIQSDSRTGTRVSVTVPLHQRQLGTGSILGISE